LHLAVTRDHSDQAKSRVLKLVDVLLESSVDINAVDGEGWTALHIAASWGLHDVIMRFDQLRGHVLNWNALTNNGESALGLALAAGADAGLLDLLQRRSKVYLMISE
jgi:ankyrin repeat protein